MAELCIKADNEVEDGRYFCTPGCGNCTSDMCESCEVVHCACRTCVMLPVS
jgi:hypothetical protein